MLLLGLGSLTDREGERKERRGRAQHAGLGCGNERGVEGKAGLAHRFSPEGVRGKENGLKILV